MKKDRKAIRRRKPTWARLIPPATGEFVVLIFSQEELRGPVVWVWQGRDNTYNDTPPESPTHPATSLDGTTDVPL